ncbi:MAG TPA: sterol desaturase family protein [Myxococcaceae bacterium]|nr:sterol desaturase family protein [Myxococcaceae bacterium]
MGLVAAVSLVLLSSNLAGVVATWWEFHSPSVIARRIQGPARMVPWEEWRGRIPLIAANLLVLLALSVAGVWRNLALFTWEVRSPAVFAAVFLLMLVLDDAYFYAYHRALHQVPFLYRTIHRIHHRAYAPVPLDYIYVHPLEWALGAIGIVIGLLATHLWLGRIPILPFLAYNLFRNVRELIIHSGLPSGVLRHLKVLGLTEHHDLHHARLQGNYGSMLHLWDMLFRTQLRA